MLELMVYCNCLKKAANQSDSNLLTSLKFDIDGSGYVENNDLQSQYDYLLKKHCIHERLSIAVQSSMPRNLPTLLHFLELKLPEQIRDWEILKRELIYAGNANGIIKVNELDMFKTEIASIWNSWEEKLNLDKEIEELLIAFESIIMIAMEMNNPILLLK